MVETKSADPGLSDAIRAEEDTRKVFVGNLPYQTTEEQLAQLFAESGTVERTQIVSRFKKSKGYGFVVFANSSEADAAVAKLNNALIEGRGMKVERARPKQDSESRPRRGVRKPKAAPGAASPSSPAEGPSKEYTAKPGANGGNRDSEAAAGGPLVEAELSKTMLFVSNLPYATTDADFEELFKKDYTVTKAYVSRYGRMRRSRGYGFVELATKDEQKRALEAPEITIDGRALKVDAAKERDVQE